MSSFSIFDDYDNAEVWYHPLADRFFIFHKATFLMLPCLEREDGAKYICTHPTDVNFGTKHEHFLTYIGKL